MPERERGDKDVLAFEPPSLNESDDIQVNVDQCWHCLFVLTAVRTPIDDIHPYEEQRYCDILFVTHIAFLRSTGMILYVGTAFDITIFSW